MIPLIVGGDARSCDRLTNTMLPVGIENELGAKAG